MITWGFRTKRIQLMGIPYVYQPEQIEILIEMLAAGYNSAAINDRFNASGLPPMSIDTIHHYRDTRLEIIQQRWVERRDSAITIGLSQREERIARLIRHAEELEPLRLNLDGRGRPVWAKEWRETLQQIAIEMGQWQIKTQVDSHNHTTVEITVHHLAAIRRELDGWEQNLLSEPRTAPIEGEIVDDGGE
jgi:hypothetical protein